MSKFDRIKKYNMAAAKISNKSTSNQDLKIALRKKLTEFMI